MTNGSSMVRGLSYRTWSRLWVDGLVWGFTWTAADLLWTDTESLAKSRRIIGRVVAQTPEVISLGNEELNWVRVIEMEINKGIMRPRLECSQKTFKIERIRGEKLMRFEVAKSEGNGDRQGHERQEQGDSAIRTRKQSGNGKGCLGIYQQRLPITCLSVRFRG